jgi:prepilin-type N-terminal cleavage/methylation domain-containing protein
MQIIKSKNRNPLAQKHSKNVFSKLLSSQASKLVRGFSLIELIITVSIMLIVTSAVLFRQAKFSSDILITNMAYEVALSVREAAVLGLSSRQDSSGYRVGYGVHFEPASESGGSPDSFINFVDVSNALVTDTVSDNDNVFDYFYTPNTADVVDKVINLTQGQRIKEYGARSSSNSAWNCGPSNGQTLNIAYVRPNPEAHITMGTNSTKNSDIYSEAKIIVESGLGDKCRTVSVSVSGQISVDPIDPNNPVGCDDICSGQ